MIDALFNQPNYIAAKSMLDVSELRQQAIAANIANVETPGYKRLEVSKSFEAEFQRAISDGDEDGIRALRPSLVVDQAAVATSRDGNTVKLEDELLDLNTNFVEHALQTRLVNGSLLKLRLAITGKV
ncbi:MAG TPA: flagellar basal body rod protein FlgB [Verrucomicrobiales bacterium]|nr:flagellar basal body rod protein FlgB [Verrucomicrobiales bacterium]